MVPIPTVRTCFAALIGLLLAFAVLCVFMRHQDRQPWSGPPTIGGVGVVDWGKQLFYGEPEVRDAALKALISGLQSDSSEVRCAAAHAFWKYGWDNTPAVEHLIRVTRDSDPSARRYAVGALGACPRERILQPLIAALDDQDSSVPPWAAQGLYELGPFAKEALPKLEACVFREHRFLRRCAAGALWSIGGEAAVRSLLVRLRDDDADKRYKAAAALGYIGMSAAKFTSVPLVRALADADLRTRQTATWALTRIGRSVEIPVSNLCEAVSHPFPRMRREVISVVGKLGPTAKDAVPYLEKVIQENREDLRALLAACDALGRLRARTAVPVLRELLDSDWDLLRERAQKALDEIGQD